MSGKLHLEDLTIGLSYTAGPILVSRDDIIRFAREFDPQPFHTDPERASSTFFGAHVASGWHTAALTMRLLVDGGIPFADGIIGTGCEISWPKPVLPGDALSVITEIVDIARSRSRPDRGIATVKCTTRNQDGETVQLLQARLLVTSAKTTAT